MSKSVVSKSGRLVIAVFALGLAYPPGQLFGQVDVSQDSPGVAYAGSGCSLTFTQGSNSVSTSNCSTPWTALQVGTILAHTAPTPNFRAVVTGFSNAWQHAHAWRHLPRLFGEQHHELHEHRQRCLCPHSSFPSEPYWRHYRRPRTDLAA